MQDFLRNQLERYAQRLQELDFLLSREDIMGDMKQYRTISREHADVTAIASRYTRYLQTEADIAAAREMLDDPDMAEMAQEEIGSGEAELIKLEDELQRLLLPKDPDDARPAFVEIRAGTGGDESALFAGDLTRMYTRYAANVGWKVEVMSASENEIGGYKEVVLRIEGDNVYGALRFESGGHRVQRVPATETQGRIHTSACTVAVMPEPDEAEAITLNPPICASTPSRQRCRRPAHQQDRLRRARGPPAHRHRGRMPGRPQPAQQQGQGPAGAAGPHPGKGTQRAGRQGSGHAQGPDRLGRPQRPHPHLQLPQGRLTDHRINLTLYKLLAVMEGDLGDVIQALQHAREAELLAELAAS
jgi:peptide chain release factor 1